MDADIADWHTGSSHPQEPVENTDEGQMLHEDVERLAVAPVRWV